MNRGRPLTNRSNYWSGAHEALLVTIAEQICREFGRTYRWLELDRYELISVGWLRVVRYRRPEELRGCSGHIRREMLKFAIQERQRRSHQS